MVQRLNVEPLLENGGGRLVLPSISEWCLEMFSPHTVQSCVGGGERI